jgi:UDP-apiose/xylose synthase
MQICLLGCGGFIGSHLVEWLIENSDVEIVGTDINNDKVRHLLDEPRFTYHHSDLRTDRAFTEALVREADVLVDLIAVASPKKYVEDPLGVFDLDFLENLRIVELCTETGTRLIQFSTCEVYGRTWLSLVPDGVIPDDLRETLDVSMNEDDTPLIIGPTDKSRWIYSVSKQMLDRIIHASGEHRGLDYTIVRPFNFVGPRFDFLPSTRNHDSSPRAVAQFMDALLQGTSLKLVDGGGALRCYTYIDDATDAIGRIILDTEGVTSRETINIGNPQNEISVEGLANLMRDIYAEEFWDGESQLSDIVSVHHEEFFGRGYQDCDRRVPNIDKARRLLGWEPACDLRSLIKKTMQAFVDDLETTEGTTLVGSNSTSAPLAPATV